MGHSHIYFKLVNRCWLGCSSLQSPLSVRTGIPRSFPLDWVSAQGVPLSLESLGSVVAQNHMELAKVWNIILSSFLRKTQPAKPQEQGGHS